MQNTHKRIHAHIINISILCLVLKILFIIDINACDTNIENVKTIENYINNTNEEYKNKIGEFNSDEDMSKIFTNWNILNSELEAEKKIESVEVCDNIVLEIERFRKCYDDDWESQGKVKWDAFENVEECIQFYNQNYAIKAEAGYDPCECDNVIYTFCEQKCRTLSKTSLAQKSVLDKYLTKKDSLREKANNYINNIIETKNKLENANAIKDNIQSIPCGYIISEIVCRGIDCTLYLKPPENNSVDEFEIESFYQKIKNTLYTKYGKHDDIEQNQVGIGIDDEFASFEEEENTENVPSREDHQIVNNNDIPKEIKSKTNTKDYELLEIDTDGDNIPDTKVKIYPDGRPNEYEEISSNNDSEQSRNRRTIDEYLEGKIEGKQILLPSLGLYGIPIDLNKDGKFGLGDMVVVPDDDGSWTEYYYDEWTHGVSIVHDDGFERSGDVDQIMNFQFGPISTTPAIPKGIDADQYLQALAEYESAVWKADRSGVTDVEVKSVITDYSFTQPVKDYLTGLLNPINHIDEPVAIVISTALTVQSTLNGVISSIDVLESSLKYDKLVEVYKGYGYSLTESKSKATNFQNYLNAKKEQAVAIQKLNQLLNGN